MKPAHFKNTALYLIALIILLIQPGCKKEINDGPVLLDDDLTLAKAADFPIGTCYEAFFNDSDPLYASIVDSHCNSITAENSMKMYSIWPNGPGTELNFRDADALVEYAQRTQKRVHGHVLLWFFNEGSVPWVRDFTGTPDEFEVIYENYVKTVVGRYKGKIASWDVINEAVTDFPVELRKDMYLRMLGPDYFYKLFKWAEEADPDAVLFYNDYLTEINDQKLDKILALCDEARRQGAKIDGIGFQAHIYFPNLMTYEQYFKAFKKVADRGYIVHISELDISINYSGQFLRPNQALFNQQYQYYKVITKAYRDAVPKDKQFGITFWGLSDRYNWLSIPGSLLGVSKADWAYPYDADMQRKPAFYGFRDGLRD